MRPRVAILMSTYNGEKYLDEQIHSILTQKGDFQIDLWVRDDCSTDSTRSILQKYQEERKLQWYTGDNLGPARSFMDLINKYKGYDYYAFADQDDYWLPGKIQAAVNAIKDKKGKQLYFSNAELVDCDLKCLGRNVYKKSPRLDFETLCCAGGILGCTTVFNAELAVAVQKKELPQKIIMHDFYMDELCLALGGSITGDLNVYMKYRQHGANVVGVSSGIVGTVKSRIKDITKRQNISIADQAEELLRIYKNEIDEYKSAWLGKVSLYKKNIGRRIAMACSRKTKYMNRNMGIKLRL